jgi:hypothetical protein
MTENNNTNNPGGGQQQPTPGDPNKGGTFSQEVRHAPVSARVPEKVARGVLSTGVLVLDSPNEFVLDFMQGLSRPFQVAARVVLTPTVMEQFVNALRENVAKYEQRFGPPPTLPKPQTDRRPTLQEIYEDFKLPDEIMSGTYANAVMVGHSPAEFFFDFITNFFPTSAVSCRVFMSAAQIPRTIEAMGTALGRFQSRVQQARVQYMPQVQPPQPPIQHPHLQQPPHPPVQQENPPPPPPPPPGSEPQSGA